MNRHLPSGASETTLQCKANRGQALTEFLATTLVLIPLFLLLPVLAKYQDINSATQLASRYVAFEATRRNGDMGGWAPEEQLSDDVRRRFFGNSNAPIKTNDVAANQKVHQNLFWRTPDDKPLIASFDSDIHVSFGSGHSDRHHDGFHNAKDGSPFALHDALSLRARGIYGASISVQIADLSRGYRFYEPFDAINLGVRRSTSILINPWTGSDPARVQDKLDDFAINPGTALRELSPVIDLFIPLAELPFSHFPTPKLGELDFWKDTIPKDRLRGQ